jgi:hypothetical protein
MKFVVDPAVEVNEEKEGALDDVEVEVLVFKNVAFEEDVLILTGETVVVSIELDVVSLT